MGRHPFGVALFIAHFDVFFHIPHSQRCLGYYTETAAAKSSTAKCDYGADEITTELPQPRLSELTERRRAQKLRRETLLMEGEARDEGASAELSDMRQRGSSDAR